MTPWMQVLAFASVSDASGALNFIATAIRPIDWRGTRLTAKNRMNFPISFIMIHH